MYLFKEYYYVLEIEKIFRLFEKNFINIHDLYELEIEKNILHLIIKLRPELKKTKGGF